MIKKCKLREKFPSDKVSVVEVDSSSFIVYFVFFYFLELFLKSCIDDAIKIQMSSFMGLKDFAETEIFNKVLKYFANI